MGSLPLEGQTNSLPPGPLSEAKPCLSPKINLSSFLCKGIYSPGGRALRASCPCCPPRGRSCCPSPSSSSVQPWDSVSPHSRLLCWAEQTHGSFWSLSAARKVPWDEEWSQTLLPACWCPWRVQSLALLCSSLASAQPEPQCQKGEHSQRDVPGRFSFFFFSSCRWLAGCDGAEEIQRRKKTGLSPPTSLRKSNLRKFIHDQHTAIAHNFVNGNLVIHNTCVGDICSGVIQY